MATEGSSPKKMRKFADAISSHQVTSDFDTATQKVLDELDCCQNEIDALNEKASEEILKVEQKYNKLRKPLFEKRNNMISNVPNFWITAMMNHPDLNVILDENEEDCLHHLTKLEVEEFEDIKSGYRIKFYFDENPYFENSVLTKEFHMGTGTPSSQSTPINWKEGCSLIQPNDNATSKGRKRRLESKSFFNWFSDNVDPTTDDIAEIIKDDLWHNPLQYYLVPDMEEENGLEEDEGSDSSADLGAEENDDKVMNKETGEGSSA